MKHYSVCVTDEALEDMNQLYEYIAHDLLSPENALKQYKRIDNAILSLDTLPERIKPIVQEHENSPGLRKMIVDNYNVFFFIENSSVIVTNVIYGASDIAKRLKERL